MAHKFENACKGLSFIDWDDLNEEEYEKLDRIINTPSLCPGVRLPFGVEYEKPNAPLQFEDPAAFPSVIPAPQIVSFSIPVHWAHGDPSVCPPTGVHYPITVPGGYVFPNPALTASGATTMAFMAPLSSSVQPMYAVSGHHIPPHYQTALMPQSEPVDLSVPVISPPADYPLMHPCDILTHASHPVPMTQVSQIVPVVSQEVSMCPESMQLPHAQQVVYISQDNIVPPLLTSNDCPTYESSHSNTAFASESLAITGLSPSNRAPSIEFGGPVVFSNCPVSSHGQVEGSSRASSCPRDHVNTDVVIDMEDVNIQKQDTQDVNIQKQNTDIYNALRISPQSPEVHTTSSSFISSADSSLATPITGCSSQEQSDSGVSNKDAAKESALKTTPPQPTKTWSSLFGNKSSHKVVTSTSVVSRPSEAVTAAVPNAVMTNEVKSVKYWQEQEKVQTQQTIVPTDKVIPVGVQNDPLVSTILEQLCNLSISHTPVVIQPRGLVNGKNTCFINATLQVLMGCPPFVHMFRDFKNLPPRSDSGSSTPIFDSLVQFVNSFHPGQRVRHQGSRSKKNTFVDVNVGQPFCPAPILSVAQNILGLHIGVQHDAEEFLSQILMICHEELEKVMKLRSSDGFNNNEKEHKSNGFSETIKNGVDKKGGDDDESWLKVGPKNHHVETNVNDCGQTHVSRIFAGFSRSCLVRESGKTSDTVDSFFTLKLDIQAESVYSVEDALLRLNTTETVHDADGGTVQGQRRMFFDVLPPVLIMHLKLFQYSDGNGQKIQKKINFDVDLVIPKETLSRVGKTKLASTKSRTYKLFGVVNHHGKKMNDGHYTSDVYLPVANGWMHFDDSEVTHINEAQVLQYSDRRMPYLLFYRRVDL